MKEKRKELQDALNSLERCCPGGISDSVKETLTSELREALFNLDRARSMEQRLREESDALLEGMNLIVSSESTIKAFEAVLAVLKRLLSFDDAFVLREQSNGCLSAVASTSPLFENLVWQPGAMFKRVLTGHSVNIRDISISTDWQGQSSDICRNVSSALHTPFNTATARAILVCTSRREGFFNKSSIQLLERFSPLAGQALYNLQINDLLRDEIRERKKAEDALREAHDNLELRVQQRTAELQASNLLLQDEINERKRAEEEKIVLLREIHHRTKNNMQIISSLMSLQSRNITDRKYKEMFRDSQNRIKSMSLVHEKLYQSGDLASIDFNDYIKALTHSLFVFYEASAGKVSSHIDAEDIVLGIDTAVPCGLIINELLSNSLKHAFPGERKGEVHIIFKKEETNGETCYNLTVSDNGIGIPENLDIRITKSLGLQLVTTLVDHQLMGTINLDRTNGTGFHIRFKEVSYKKRI